MFNELYEIAEIPSENVFGHGFLRPVRRCKQCGQFVEYNFTASRIEHPVSEEECAVDFGMHRAVEWFEILNYGPETRLVQGFQCLLCKEAAKTIEGIKHIESKEFVNEDGCVNDQVS